MFQGETFSPPLYLLTVELKKKIKIIQMEGIKGLMMGALPFAAMLTLQFGSVVSLTICKAAMTKGLSSFVFTVYHNALGTLILFPLFIYHRHRNMGPPLTPALLASFFLVGLLGVTMPPVLGNMGIKYVSSTLAAALANLVPGFTFLIAVIFGMEKVALRSRVSQAKILGTIASVSGALIVTFYKCPPVLMVLSQKSNWVLGGVLLTITFLSSSTRSVCQAVLKDHPDKLTLIFFSCLFGSVMCAVISLVVERNMSAWTLHLRIEVIAVVCGTIVDTVFSNSIIAWVLHKKGPVYVALFTSWDSYGSGTWSLLPRQKPSCWQFDWSNCCYSWVLCCDMGTGQRKRHCWWEGLCIRIIREKDPTLAKRMTEEKRKVLQDCLLTKVHHS